MNSTHKMNSARQFFLSFLPAAQDLLPELNQNQEEFFAAESVLSQHIRNLSLSQKIRFGKGVQQMFDRGEISQIEYRNLTRMAFPGAFQ
jgi:hypothetical protein